MLSKKTLVVLRKLKPTHKNVNFRHRSTITTMYAEQIIHRNENRIKVVLPYDSLLVSKLRTIQGASWSQTLKAWHVPNNKITVTQLKTLFPELDFRQAKPIKNEKNAIESTKQLAEHTIEQTKNATNQLDNTQDKQLDDNQIDIRKKQIYTSP